MPERPMKSAQYEALLNNVPGIVYRCRIDDDWTMLYVSEGIRELTGYPAEEFILNASLSFGSIVEPSDRAKVRKVIRKAVQKKRAYTVEYRIISKDAEVRWVYERGRAEYDENGEPFQLIGAILDITPLHSIQMAMETEKELFRLVIDNIPGVVYRAAIWDHWDIELLSDQAAVLLGIDPEHKIGTDLRDFYREIAHPDDLEILLQLVERGVNSGMPFELKYRVRWPDGSSHWVMEKGQAQMSEFNHQKYLCGVILDVTQSRKVQKELDDIKARLFKE